MNLEASGRVTIPLSVGRHTVQERFYPLCADAIETSIIHGDTEATVRPDTYKRLVRVRGRKI